MNVLLVVLFIVTISGLVYVMAKKNKTNQELADKFGMDKEELDKL